MFHDELVDQVILINSYSPNLSLFFITYRHQVRVREKEENAKKKKKIIKSKVFINTLVLNFYWIIFKNVLLRFALVVHDSQSNWSTGKV